MQAIAVSAVYPEGGSWDSGLGFHTGPAHKSVADGLKTPSGALVGGVINVGQGWPPAGAVDAAMKAGNSLVSIYAVPSSTSKQPVPLDTGSVAEVAPPVHGMSAESTPTGFRLHGLPCPGEYCTAIVNGVPYSCIARRHDGVEVIAAYLAYAIAVRLPGATWSSAPLAADVVIPGLHSLVVRIGAPGLIGRTIDRQAQNVMLGVWAPTPSDRSAIGRVIQEMVAQNLTVEMPDTSRSIWRSQGVNLIDKYENELAFRRDLTVQCQWDTVETFPGYEVTAINVTLDTRSGEPVVPRIY